MKPNFETKLYCPACKEALYRDGNGFWCYGCVQKYEFVKGELK